MVAPRSRLSADAASRLNPLAPLAERLRAQGGAAALGEPIILALLATDNSIDLSALEDAFRVLPTLTLGQVLEGHPASLGCGLSTRDLNDEVFVFFQEYVGRLLQQEVASVPLPEPPPRGPQLVAWANRHGLIPLLSEYVHRACTWWLDPDAFGSGCYAQVGAALLEAERTPSYARSREFELEVAKLRAWLQAGAIRVAREARRFERLNRLRAAPPSDPLLAQAAQVANELLRTFAVTPKVRKKVQAWRLDGRWNAALEGDDVLGWNIEEGRTFVRVAVDLSQLRAAGHLEVRCRCGYSGSRPCAHRVAAVEAFLDLVHGACPELRTLVLAALSKTVGARALRAVDAALQRLGAQLLPDSRPERVRFRVRPGAHPSLTFETDRPSPDAGWGERAGLRAASLEELADWECADFPGAGEAVRLLAASVGQAWAWSYGRPALTAPSLFLAFERLVGYPEIYLEGRPGAPACIRRAEAELHVEAQSDGGAVLRVAVGGEVALASTLSQVVRDSQHPGHCILGHPERAEIVLVRLSNAQVALLKALPLAADFDPAGRAELLGRLPALERHFPVRLPPELQGDEVPADHRVILRLAPEGEAGLRLEARVQPLAHGPRFAPGAGPQRVSGVAGGVRSVALRDLAEEVARTKGLLARLLGTDGTAASGGGRPPDETEWTRHLRGEQALDLLGALEQVDPAELVVEWPEERWRVSAPVQAKQLKVRVEDRRDWFGLEGEVDLGDEKVALGLLLAAMRRGERYVAIGPRRWMAIGEDLRRRLEPVADVVHPTGGAFEVGFAAAPALEALFDRDVEVQRCGAWLESVRRMRAAAVAEPSVPADLRAELRPYQIEGFRWLARLAQWGVGAVLADDMGLGKTVQALAVLLERRERGPALVVAPTSVCFNWVREAERLAPGLRPILFREGDRAATLRAAGPGDLLVCSYGLLVRHAEDFKGVRFGTLVVDEAQALKNAATRRARAARELDAEWRLALSGTPLENHLGELWSLFRIVVPGLLGSWEAFLERFANPIEREKDAARLAALSRLVRPFVLRRTKDQVARDLPARTEIRDVVSLSAGERQLYDAARLAAVADLAEADGPEQQRRFEILAAITRLRQLACHPRLVDPGFPGDSAKLTRLLALVDELRENGHRALVFSQFTTHLALVREALDARKVRYLYLDGQTPPPRRAELVDAFQDGEAELFLISLKAGGTGLNLTAADYVIHLDPWWNPAVEDQATDRAHRIGQRRPVTVYRLVAKGTIEEAILALHQEKRDLVAGVLEGAGAAARLSTQQLLALVRAGEAAPDLGEEGEGGEETPAEALSPDEVNSTNSASPSIGPSVPNASIARAVPSPPSRSGLPYAEETPLGRRWGMSILAHLETEVSASSAKVYFLAVRRFFGWADGQGIEDASRADLTRHFETFVRQLEEGRLEAPPSAAKSAYHALNKLRRWGESPS